jgi:hypothetical protein
LNLRGVEGADVMTVSEPIASTIRAMRDVEGVDSAVECSAGAGLMARRLCCKVTKVAASIPFIKHVTQSLRASVKKIVRIISGNSDRRRNERRRSNSI